METALIPAPARCRCRVNRCDHLLRFLAFSLLHLLNYAGNVAIMIHIYQHIHPDRRRRAWYLAALASAHFLVGLYCARLAWVDREVRSLSKQYGGLCGHCLVSMFLGLTQLIQLKIAYGKYTRREVMPADREDPESDTDSDVDVSSTPHRWRHEAERAAMLENTIPWTFPSKCFEGMFEGTVFASFLLYFLLVTDDGSDSTIENLFSDHWQWGITLPAVGFLSFLTIAMSMMNYDYHLSPAIQKSIDRSIGYTILHAMFRGCETGSRICVLVSFVFAFHYCRTSYSRLLPIFLIFVDFVAGVLLMRFLSVKEERKYRSLRSAVGCCKGLLVTVPTGVLLMITNLAEFVDEAERDALMLSAKRFSKVLRVVRLVQLVIVLAFLLVGMPCRPAEDTLFRAIWRDHKGILICYLLATLLYNLAILFRFHRAALLQSGNVELNRGRVESFIARSLSLPDSITGQMTTPYASGNNLASLSEEPSEDVEALPPHFENACKDLTSLVEKMKKFAEWDDAMESLWSQMNHPESANDAMVAAIALMESSQSTVCQPQSAEWKSLAKSFVARLRLAQNACTVPTVVLHTASFPMMAEERPVPVEVVENAGDLPKILKQDLIENGTWYHNPSQEYRLRRAPSLPFLLFARGIHGSVANMVLTPIGEEEVLPNDTLVEEERVRMSDFDVLERIGAGSYAPVYKCRKKSTGVVYAMKRLMKNNYAFRKGSVENLLPRRERDTLCLSGRHPNVATLAWAFETDHFWILVMEFCDLGSLTSYMKQKRSGNPWLEDCQVARFGGHILQGLHHLHSHNIMHRDVKTDNIGVLGPEELATAKLIDFGFAKRAEARQSSTIVGSYGYCAPELENARIMIGAMRQSTETFDERIDIYAFGIVLFVMCVGREAEMQGNLWSHTQFREMLKDPHSTFWSCRTYHKHRISGTSALSRMEASGALQTIATLTATKRDSRPRTVKLASRLPLFRKHPGSVPSEWMDGPEDDALTSFEWSM